MRDAPDRARARKPLAAPLDDAALIGLGNGAFAGLGAVLLGVSGGPDSMALMLLATHWLAAAGPAAPSVHVATVDHRLRAGSADEAAWVACQATAMGFKHHALVWAGAKPATGRQQAARDARYRLLADLVASLSPAALDGQPVGIALAHHLDDQAETFIMRLQRGSGVDGLAGMKPMRGHAGSPRFEDGRPGLGPEIRIVRPFLAIAKSRLLATLQARNIPWLEDPSNVSADFERVRIRKAMKSLHDLGLTSEVIGTSAQRLARAGAALEQLTEELAGRALQTHAGAYAQMATADFDAAPVELRLRLVQRLVRWYGGASEPPRMTKLEALAVRLAQGRPMASTLGGCQIRRTDVAIRALREPGRAGLPVLELQPGEAATWDRRFLVSAGPCWPGPVIVKALPAETLTRLDGASRQAGAAPISLPRAAALGLPSFWHGDRLLAVAHPDFGGCGPGLAEQQFFCDNLSAQFVTS